jgi:hypothetical protein
MLGMVTGGFAAWKVGPLQRIIERSNAIFKKPWLRIPIPILAFGCAYYGGT